MGERNFFEPVNFKFLVGNFNICESDWGETDCNYGYHKFYYFKGGEGTIIIGGTTYRPRPGDLYLIPAGTTHSYFHNPEYPVEKYWCHFDMILGEDRKLVYHPRTLTCRPDEELCRQLFRQLTGNGPSDEIVTVLKEKSALMQLMIEFLGRVDSSQMLVSDSRGILSGIDAYIHSRLADEISLKDLAGIASLHPNYFIPFFKKRVGITPIEHVHNIRLKEATKMLNSPSGETIQNIALKTGFRDYRYFSRLFKRKYGLSPSAYRSLGL